MLGSPLEDKMKQEDEEAIRGVHCIGKRYRIKQESMMERLPPWTLHRNSFKTHQPSVTLKIRTVICQVFGWYAFVDSLLLK